VLPRSFGLFALRSGSGLTPLSCFPYFLFGHPSSFGFNPESVLSKRAWDFFSSHRWFAVALLSRSQWPVPRPSFFFFNYRQILVRLNPKSLPESANTSPCPDKPFFLRVPRPFLFPCVGCSCAAIVKVSGHFLCTFFCFFPRLPTLCPLLPLDGRHLLRVKKSGGFFRRYF